MTQTFSLNATKFASQAFADEVIVLDATNGTYYALTGNAPDIWTALLAGAPLDQIVAAVVSQTGAESGQVSADLKAFTDSLAAESVLLPAEKSEDHAASEITADPIQTYEGFVWEKHSDLDELLVLDPIHEVNPEKGWPHAG